MRSQSRERGQARLPDLRMQSRRTETILSIQYVAKHKDKPTTSAKLCCETKTSQQHSQVRKAGLPPLFC